MSARRLGVAAAFVLSLALLAACRGRQPSGELRASPVKDEQPQGPGLTLVFDLRQGAPESTAAGGFFPLPASRTYTGLVRSIERALKEQDATSCFVRLGGAGFGWARSEELGRLFAKLKTAGKPVVCHAHSVGNSTLWMLARGCSEIWLSPAGDVDTVGIAAQLVYLKPALDKLHVQADFLHMGKYKGAAEPLTHDAPSDATREALDTMLASIRKVWLDTMPTAGAPRRLEALEGGPWSAEEAKQLGLVHAVGYESDALKSAQERGKAGRTQVVFGPESTDRRGVDIAELIRVLTGADDAAAGRPHLVVVPAEGGINMESGGPFDAGGIIASALSKTIRRLAEDDRVKAVVLRIDSPGGSALASDLLWHELMQLREKKPLIASVGEMAASGGYYLASAANRIVAEQTSIVGSIGVVGGKIVFGPALERVGVRPFVFPASDAPGAANRAAYLSPLVPWNEATRERVRAQMRDIYELFVQRAAEGRGLPEEKILASAEGRVWSGAQAKDRGLFDELGGLYEAIGLARRLSGLDEHAPVRVEGGSETLVEQLLLGQSSTEAEVLAALERFERQKSPLVRLIPSTLRPFAAGIQALGSGETTLTALPFSLVVQ